ncbi:hypothetical protein M413DRAFT_396222 [Hebeloma cylindrosporum]|uniref:Uncharacterized protein n=1 Tax=Hebeloma cylindrosporum TaxID=76867 RepID=A0A0C2XZV1_HEBCY|nr:hypothetical protein M413DRAFT_396222 [Hebeloma cylindrosporum h7]
MNGAQAHLELHYRRLLGIDTQDHMWLSRNALRSRLIETLEETKQSKGRTSKAVQMGIGELMLNSGIVSAPEVVFGHSGTQAFSMLSFSLGGCVVWHRGLIQV